MNVSMEDTSCFLKSTVLFLTLQMGIVAGGEPTIDFRRQIQPILSEHCNLCHGEDPGTRQGGLRLDVDADAYKGGESGSPAIQPGHSAKSLLIERILSSDKDSVMPPPNANKPLNEEQKKLFRQWIDEGAKYESHWAFTPPVQKPLPVETKNPIDAFVKNRLQQAGFSLTTRATPATLARRIQLDTIGVVPSPAETTSFEKTPIETRIDELLASERFGEKWARHWLDVARYSDTNGYEKDMRRDQWAWRDWVIGAMNRDMPYDQFVIEQIAGDLLPNATQDQMIATGFLRNSMINEEGAIVPEQFRMAEMFDRMDCIGKGVLGLTTQCVQCHTHKFDPITHDEYYGMFAYLNNCYEAQSPVYAPEQLKAVQAIRESIIVLENQLKKDNPAWESEVKAFETDILSKQADWKTVAFDDLNSVSGLNHPATQTDGSILMTGHSSSDVYMIGSPELAGVTGFRIEVLNHGDLPLRGPGRNANGGWQIHTIEIKVQKPDTKEWVKLKIVSSTADFSTAESKSGDGKLTYGPVANLFDDKPETFWTSDRGKGRRNQPSVAVAVFEQPLDLPPGTRFKVEMHMADNVGCCRMSLTKTPQPFAPACDHAGVLAMRKVESDRNQADRDAVFACWRKSKPEHQSINAQIDARFDQMPDHQTTVLHLAERENSAARPTRLLDRGEWDKPKHDVLPHVPRALNPMPDQPDGAASGTPARLAFARWLVDRRSPLAARVAVNRIWQAIFGDGLVETSEDFGTRTATPEYADLLDYLAVDFMEHGWSQKHLIKIILMSETYQQSSVFRKELMELDPKNRLLGRGPRFRVEAEVVRDVALAASGLLSNKLGGPSVIPPVPQNLLNYNYVVPTYWTAATGPDRYRRAVYVFRKRSMPDPVMASFDSPNGDFSCARRVRSNTPLAALTGLNETIFVEAAQAMALRVLREGGTDDTMRTEYAYVLCTSRKPSAGESLAIQELLSEQRKRIAEGWLNPREIATSDPAKLPQLPDGVTPQDAAAWTIVSRVLLNCDETLSKN
ncbi:MAG: PSD1 and planctomycete cytochrome C domain-containing protein [Planctomycetota bacterium]|nr:PSD1 and planctomycete cytochrome C domain-containing protein [Planctomycetota bacterium]